jgi:hypothetical protein
MATTTSAKRILAFDIGIKNLAYCLLEVREGAQEIISWENINILNDSAAGAPVAKPPCRSCAKGANWALLTWQDGALQPGPTFCARHIPASTPALTDAAGKQVKSLPVIAELKEAAARLKLGKPAGGAQKRDNWVALFHEKCCLPLKAFVKKAPPTMHAGMETMHDGILAMIFNDARYDLLLSANKVLLENQPVLKNPTMKTVQVLLFATLRDAFKAEHGAAPPFHLVHAGKKVRGAEAGDAGYAARKEGGETRVKEWLEANAAGSAWEKQFLTAAKKSDLADALCMCLDAS